MCNSIKIRFTPTRSNRSSRCAPRLNPAPRRQTYLITLIHYMGGSIRKDMSSKVTHLIAAAATGDKYRYASGFGLPVLARSWVDACWERRADAACLATDDAVIVSYCKTQQHTTNDSL